MWDSFLPRDGLSQSSALSLLEDREGSLWVGTKRGLNQFADGRIVLYSASEGLPSNEAGPVLQDSKGVIWAGTLGCRFGTLRRPPIRANQHGAGPPFQCRALTG
ncbi:MAG: two-component regulator propeller domain-containing protein [Acidobacteriota bacterium]